MTVIFQHIPKAAGSTLLSIFKREYSPAESYHLSGPGRVREAEFARLPSDRLAQLRLITGHLYFGIHTHLAGPFTYVTMLRHPVDRVISHYYYVKRSPHHYLYSHVTSENMTLEQYVSSRLSLELNNGQVRSLFGLEHHDIPYGECPLDMLHQAQEHLHDSYSVVGITERFDESVLLLHHRLGWTFPPLYVRKNVARRRTTVPAVPSSVIRTIQRDNALDLVLYEHAFRAFADEIERSDLWRELRHFRFRNRLYTHYISVKQKAWRIVDSM